MTNGGFPSRSASFIQEARVHSYMPFRPWGPAKTHSATERLSTILFCFENDLHA